MIIQRSLVVSGHKRGGEGSVFPLRMRIFYEGRKADIPLGITVDVNRLENNRVSGGPDAGKINSAISSMETHIEEIFTRYELIENRVPDPHELKEKIKERETPSSLPVDGSIFRRYEEFMQYTAKRNGWESATRDKFKYLGQHVKKLFPRLRFDQIDEDMMMELLQYFYKAGMMNPTISKYLSMFRNFLRWAKRRGHYNGHQHETFRPRLKGSSNAHHQVIYLTWSELMMLYDMKFERSEFRLEHTRDCFLFLCFTGLRYSDLAKLKRMDIGKDDFSFVSKKGAERTIVELNKYSRSILDKYKRVNLSRSRALPTVSNQKMNDNLKDLCEMAGMHKMIRQVVFVANKRKEIVAPKFTFITTHCGRRSFIVNALYLGIAPEVIMSWTGHADFRAMRPYVAIVDEIKKEGMRRFDAK